MSFRGQDAMRPRELESVYNGARPRLMQELKEFQKEKWVNVEASENSLFKWSIGLMVINEDSVFNGAYLKAEMTFTEQYPMAPPSFKFTRPINHPNIYKDGRVCISILHAPGEDEQSGETAAERWNPMHSVESVLRSILILLDEPEVNSPANVDAGVMFRDNRAIYNEKARADVLASKEDIPKGFVMPTSNDTAPPPKFEDEADFWAESGDEEDFGGSDSEDDFDMDEDEDEEGGEDQEDEDEMKQ